MGLGDTSDEDAAGGGAKLFGMTLFVFTKLLRNMESLFDVIKLSNMNPDTPEIDRNVKLEIKMNK